MTPSLVVLGASGFVGQALLESDWFPLPVKAVARAVPPAAASRSDVTWCAADLMTAGSLDAVLSPGDIVINLAFAMSAGEAANVALIQHVIDACVRRRAVRLVHCSTAVIAGAASTDRIDETTPCEPLTPYETTKWAVEQCVIRASAAGLDAVILRPTAVVGPGGENLRKLTRALLTGNVLNNYLRACLFGRRNMHLVPVRDVVAAVLHVATMPAPLRGEVYIVSADTDPANAFDRVEAELRLGLGLAARMLPVVRVPPGALGFLLRLLGRSETNLRRVYDSAKLRATGFVPVDSVAAAVREFGEQYGREE